MKKGKRWRKMSKKREEKAKRKKKRRVNKGEAENDARMKGCQIKKGK